MALSVLHWMTFSSIVAISFISMTDKPIVRTYIETSVSDSNIVSSTLLFFLMLSVDPSFSLGRKVFKSCEFFVGARHTIGECKSLCRRVTRIWIIWLLTLVILFNSFEGSEIVRCLASLVRMMTENRVFIHICHFF